MVQGIASLDANTVNRQARQPLRSEDQGTKALAQAFSGLSNEDVSGLRGLSTRLLEMSEEELVALQQIIDFVQRKSDQYDLAVQTLIRQGIVEAGDLPPDYIPAFFEILSALINDALSKVGNPEVEEQRFAKGGIAQLAKAGRKGDTMLAHLSPKSAAALKRRGGSGTINPKTGLREYFLDDLFEGVGDFLKGAAGVVLPIALSIPFGPIVGGALGSGIAAMINGANPQDALMAGLVGGAGGALFSGAQSMFNGGSFMQGVTGGLPSGMQAMFAQPTTGAAAVTPAAQVAGGSGNYMGKVGAASSTAAASPAAASPGFFDSASNWISQNPMLAVGGAGLAGLALASAMTPEEEQQKLEERNVEPTRFAPGTFKVYEAPRVNVVPTYSPAYADGGSVDFPRNISTPQGLFDYLNSNRPTRPTPPTPILPENWKLGDPMTQQQFFTAMESVRPTRQEASAQDVYDYYSRAFPSADLASLPFLSGVDTSGDDTNTDNTETSMSTGIKANTTPYSRGVTVVPTYSPAYAAQGGEIDARHGGHLKGPGTGTSDSIPARLSDGEFVMTARAVRGAGNGSREAGAKKMYNMMHKFEKRA